MEDQIELQKGILKDKVLVMAPRVLKGVSRKKGFTAKNIPEATYLNLTEKQSRILEEFGKGKTSANVLEALIWQGKAPRLQEYFELIIKAYQNRILVEIGSEQGALKEPCDTFPTLSMGTVWLVVLFTIPFSVFASWSSPLVFPNTIWDILLGLFYSVAGLSLGKFLAGAFLAQQGGEVYQPGWKWKDFLPHWSIDLIDGRVVHPSVELYMGCLRLLPLVFLFGVTSLFHPGSAGILLLALWCATFPARYSAIDQILKGMTHRIALDIHRNFIFFSKQKSFSGKFRGLKYENKSYLGLKIIYFCLWISFLVGATILSLHYYFAPLAELIDPKLVLYVLTGVFITSAVGYPLYLLLREVFPTLRHKYNQRKERKRKERERASFDENHPPSTALRVELMSRNAIFQGLPPKHLNELARRMVTETFPRGSFITRTEKPPKRLYLLLSGSVAVSRKLSTGKVLKITSLQSGAVFGQIPFWDDARVPRTIQATTKVTILSLEAKDLMASDEFLRDRNIARNGVKLNFLSHYRPFSEWPPELVREMASASSFMSLKQEETVVHLNQPNQFFYIVYDGVLRCQAKGRVLRTYRLGDYFGELSVLRNALAVADVVCKEDGKCLVIGKKHLLRILTKYPEALLQMERVASKRLGQPIFPIQDRSGWENYRAK